MPGFRRNETSYEKHILTVKDAAQQYRRFELGESREEVKESIEVLNDLGYEVVNVEWIKGTQIIEETSSFIKWETLV